MRKNHVSVRYTDKEMKRLEKLANLSNMKLSEYIRITTLGAKLKPTIIVDEGAEQRLFLEKKILQQKNNVEKLIDYIDQLTLLLGNLNIKSNEVSVSSLFDLLMRTPSKYDNALKTCAKIKKNLTRDS